MTLNATLHGEKQATPSGDVGVYFADDPERHGRRPTSGRRRLRGRGTGVGELAGAVRLSGDRGTKQVTVPAGKYLAFYLITSGTTADFLDAQPDESVGGAQGFVLVRRGQSGQRRITSAGSRPASRRPDPSVAQLHVMDKVGGKISDFDAFAIDLSFTA